ncbi:MAG: histidine phosphatase family protein [Myxococcota bacterium]
MMRLIVLRHAKSAWDTDAPTDHARPLNQRGQRDAPRIGAKLAEMGWVPDAVLSSDAARTRETWARMAAHIAPEQTIPVTVARRLYHAGPETVMPLLAGQPATRETVMVIGHNPGLEALLEALCGQAARLTTCNAALMTSTATDWTTAMSDRWILHHLLRPKEI